MLEGLIASLIGIAFAVGLDKSIDRINESLSNKREVSPDDVIHSINLIINEARQKGEDTLRKLNNRLGSIQFPLGMSPSVKNFIIDQRNKLAKVTENTTQAINKVEKELGDVENRASNLAYQSADYRRIFGKEKLERITEDAQTAVDRMSIIQKGVEQDV